MLIMFAETYSHSVPELGRYESIHSLIDEFSCDSDVQKVSVNSTLSKRYIKDRNECLTDEASEASTPDYGEEVPTDDCEENQPDNGRASKSDSDEITSDDSVLRATTYGEERKSGDEEPSRLDGGEMRKPLENKMVISGDNRGRALIICNNLEISSNATSHEITISKRRSETLTSAQKILTDHFGFAVSNKQNFTVFISQILLVR